MKLACLVPYPLDTVPGQRFRTEQWADPLRSQGITVDFFPLLPRDVMAVLYQPGHFLHKARAILAGCARRVDFVLRRCRDFDVVLVQREAVLLGVDWIERALVRQVPVCFDLDDAIWLPNVSPANRAMRFLKGFAKIGRIMRMVHSISAGCGYLADYARRFNPNVRVVPVSIDLAKYQSARPHQSVPLLTVGWTGSTTTASYLALIQDALARAAQRIPLRLKVLGGQVQVPGVEVECVPWRPEIEVDVIRTFDVGLKPSPREEWAKGKCPMKDLQYMALGIPPIATRFGTMLESIEHGRTGFLCDSDDDWVTALERLRDPALRTEMGQAGRQVVEQRYSKEVASRLFVDALLLAQKTFRDRASA